MFIVYATTALSLNENLLIKLNKALQITNSSIAAIYDEWAVNSYPNFLKSCFMHKSSWDIMKTKYKRRILDAFDAPRSFVISFTGR